MELKREVRKYVIAEQQAFAYVLHQFSLYLGPAEWNPLTHFPVRSLLQFFF